METIYLLSPITVISLKAIDLSNRGWNVVTPSDRMLSIILAESEHLDNLGYLFDASIIALVRTKFGCATRCSLTAR